MAASAIPVATRPIVERIFVLNTLRGEKMGREKMGKKDTKKGVVHSQSFKQSKEKPTHKKRMRQKKASPLFVTTQPRSGN